MNDQLANKVHAIVRRAQFALKESMVQARSDLAKRARKHLIRQVYHGDRVLARLRDGFDPDDEYAHLDLSVKLGTLAVGDLRRSFTCNEGS